MKTIILHIDMNSYFASVEQQANPFLRGKAVGVCAYLSPNGCIIASSMEAKAKGIRTGCRVSDALKIDPEVILVENEPAKYRSTTEKIFKILSQYTDTLEPYSIDEAFLDLSGWVKDFEAAEKIGEEMQARIKKEIGEWLGCSVGISWTKFLAKFGSDVAAKKSVLVIDKNNLDGLLENRPLTDAWGINKRMEARLNLLGIYDLLGLKNYNSDRIRRSLGRYGYYLWAGVNGIEISTVNQGTVLPKSVGHSYCLYKKSMDKKYLGEIFYKLCEKTGRRLRGLEMEARGISIILSFVNGSGIHKSFKTSDIMFTTEEIYGQIDNFLQKIELFSPVSMLAVSVFSLSPVSSQMSFFEDKLGQKELSRALDKLNDKYGEYTVIRGAMFGTETAAKDRVGFRKTVELNCLYNQNVL